MKTAGIDLGGTNIAVGVVTEAGEIISQAQRRTNPERAYQQVIRDMAETTLEAIEKAGLTPSKIGSIGVGVPGLFDNETGKVVFCTNLNWHDVPLREEMQKVSICRSMVITTQMWPVSRRRCSASARMLTRAFF
jgi:glucokinase